MQQQSRRDIKNHQIFRGSPRENFGSNFPTVVDSPGTGGNNQHIWQYWEPPKSVPPKSEVPETVKIGTSKT